MLSRIENTVKVCECIISVLLLAGIWAEDAPFAAMKRRESVEPRCEKGKCVVGLAVEGNRYGGWGYTSYWLLQEDCKDTIRPEYVNWFKFCPICGKKFEENHAN
jgi:hypothetical protein